MPLITHLMALGHRVFFAGNEAQNNYVHSTFDAVETIHLEGYNVRYATSRLLFMPAILKQVPDILAVIKREHEWLKKIAKEYRIDAIISDNRYGLYHASVPSAIMTHQLQVK